MNEGMQYGVRWEDADQRLDRWLRRRFKGLVQSRIERLCRKGLVRIDGKRARPSDRLKEGQTIGLPKIEDRVAPDLGKDAPASARAGRNRDLLTERLLHIDEHILVINKPPGLAVQGGTGQSRHLDGMASELGLPDGEVPKLVHRLDKDTSGVLLMARTRRAAAALARLFRNRSLRKVYLAAVCGSPPDDGGTILSSVHSNGIAHLRTGRDTGSQLGTGTALTHYRVLDRLGQRFALVALNPVTGRTHQLRVHMAELGTPIVGDRRHGGAASADRGGIFRGRLHLHAHSLELKHPFTGRGMGFVAPLPPHMEESFNALGWGARLADRQDPFAGPA